MPAKRFPMGLLNRPDNEIMNYWNKYVLLHPYLEQAQKEVVESIYYPLDSSIVFIIGPSGVGKKVLAKRVINEIMSREQPKIEQDPSYIPIGYMTALPPISGKYSWKEHFKRALAAIKEPMIDQKAIYFRTHNINPDIGYSEALKNSYYNRKTKAIIIDEAQHLSKIAGPRKFQDQLDVIKAMAEETNVVHILVGTYELLVLTDLSAQINNRAWAPIEFRRYHAEDKAGRRMFKSILKTFELYLPLEEEIDLVKDWAFFYEQTAGCVGTLKKLLHKALSAKLQDKNAEIPFSEYIKNNALYSKQCLENLREAKEGEKRFDDMKCQLDQLKHELGLTSDTQDQEILEIKVPEKKGRKDVGKRNPVRDPVGKIHTQDEQSFSSHL